MLGWGGVAEVRLSGGDVGLQWVGQGRMGSDRIGDAWSGMVWLRVTCRRERDFPAGWPCRVYSRMPERVTQTVRQRPPANRHLQHHTPQRLRSEARLHAGIDIDTDTYTEIVRKHAYI